MFMSLKHCVHSFLCVCRVFASHPIVYDDSVTLNFGLSAVFVGVVNGSIWKWSKMGTKLLFSGKVGLPLGHTFEIYHWWNKVIGKVKTVSFGLYFLKTLRILHSLCIFGNSISSGWLRCTYRRICSGWLRCRYRRHSTSLPGRNVC